MSIYVPTYLYIKQHTVTGKLYLGKTTRNDPLSYNGSGKHWSSHIKKHGKDKIVTLWFYLYDNIFDLVADAMSMSQKLDIVNSKSWLNLIKENGLAGVSIGTVPHNKGKSSWNKGLDCSNYNMGSKGTPMSDYTKQKISKSIKNWHEINKINRAPYKLSTPRKPYSFRNKHNIVICPHCGKDGGDNIMKRWHFDNCKSKEGTSVYS